MRRKLGSEATQQSYDMRAVINWHFEAGVILGLEVVALLVDKGYNPEYGARPMRRAIERLLEDPIAEAILRGDLAPGHNSVAVRNKKTDAIEFREVLPAKPRPKPAKAAAKQAPAKETKKPRKK